MQDAIKHRFFMSSNRQLQPVPRSLAGHALRYIFPGKDAAAITERFSLNVQAFAAQEPERQIRGQRVIPASLVHHAPFFPPGIAAFVFIPALAVNYL